MRIYEQFEKSLSAKENADFLKNEYGWGGSYPVIIGAGIDERDVYKRQGVRFLPYGETKIETPEKGASFEIYLKSAGSYDAANKMREIPLFAMKMASVRQKICRMVCIPYTRLPVGKAER